MKCVLHIGSAKTATSSLQQMLFDHQRAFPQNDWLYPSTGLWQGDKSHNKLGIYFWNGLLDHFKITTFDVLLDKFFEEISGRAKIIVSSELIEKALVHGNGSVQVFLRRLAMSGYEIEVVYVVRRQDQFMDSHFKQIVGDPFTLYAGSVADYTSRTASNLFYARIAAAWEAMPEVSSVRVLPYGEGRVRETIMHVLSMMGRQDIVACHPEVPMVNPSLDGTFLRLKHRLNQIEMPRSLHQRFLDIATLNLSDRSSSERLTLFAFGERQDLLRRFEDDDRELANRYGSPFAGWKSDDRVDGPVFRPIAGGEAHRLMERLRDIDGQLATEISEHTAGKADFI